MCTGIDTDGVVDNGVTDTGDTDTGDTGRIEIRDTGRGLSPNASTDE